MRRALAYPAHDVGPFTTSGHDGVRLPMDAPTRATANHFGDQALRGIKTSLNLAMTVPIQRPYGGGGWEVTAFPLLQPSRAARDEIVVVIGSAQNFFSPTYHSNPLSDIQPPPAVKPSKDITMPPKMGKRGTGGHFTIPAPMGQPSWPTSSDWLASRTVR